jgi:putative membrane protein
MLKPILFATFLGAMSSPAGAVSSQGVTPAGSLEAPSAGGAPEADQGSALTKSEREFVDEAAQGSLLEMKLGQLAVQKAQTDEVKRFGQRMVDDHTAMSSRLQKLVQRKGLTMPQELDKKSKDQLDRLSKKTGLDFDKDYVNDMVNDHQRDVDRFEKAIKEAKDPDVKEFATTTLPMLSEHLGQVKAIQAKFKT